MRAAVSLSLSLLLGSRVASAGNDEPIGYAVVAAELGTAGVFAANFNNVWPNHGPALMLNMTPILLGVGAGLGSHYADLPAEPALAVHGAGWFGIAGFLGGALIDGRAESWGLRAGPMAWTLGALGAIGGGVLGATAVDGSSQRGYWLAAAPAGFVGGGLVLGGLLVILGGVDGDTASGQFATGALVGTALGLGVSTYFALHGSTSTTARVQPAVTGPALSDDSAHIFSFGGAW